MAQAKKNYLFIRLDRIGDLVLTLPVDESFPEARVQWWIPKNLSFVTQNAEPKREAREIAKAITRTEFIELLAWTRRQHFDAAVVFNAPWWVSLLLWLARIPIRAGVRSKWHSFFFLNRSVRQKRSRSEHSELEYNYLLAEEAFRLSAKTLPRRTLRLGERIADSDAQKLLGRFGLFPRDYSVVHPGMGGSALNWPIGYYGSLIEEKSQDEIIAITGTAADEPYLAPLRLRLKDVKNVVWLDQKLGGSELITVLRFANTVTAPSTGVLHLAASTGVATLGIFSPVQVQRPKRWGPQGFRTATVMPDVPCPGKLSCLGPACEKYDCMQNISVAQVMSELENL
jgi:heptosyltransferase I